MLVKLEILGHLRMRFEIVSKFAPHEKVDLGLFRVGLRLFNIVLIHPIASENISKHIGKQPI